MEFGFYHAKHQPGQAPVRWILFVAWIDTVINFRQMLGLRRKSARFSEKKHLAVH